MFLNKLFTNNLTIFQKTIRKYIHLVENTNDSRKTRRGINRNIY